MGDLKWDGLQRIKKSGKHSIIRQYLIKGASYAKEYLICFGLFPVVSKVLPGYFPEVPVVKSRNSLLFCPENKLQINL